MQTLVRNNYDIFFEAADAISYADKVLATQGTMP
jgi:hypothetical protein